ncbi:hypothetical protein ZWY2020_051715 [Hordeum vulgare]|nr:hypothetical protein ZWY2020_051715 [Hordeum vulgare]
MRFEPWTGVHCTGCTASRRQAAHFPHPRTNQTKPNPHRFFPHSHSLPSPPPTRAATLARTQIAAAARPAAPLHCQVSPSSSSSSSHSHPPPIPPIGRGAECQARGRRSKQSAPRASPTEPRPSRRFSCLPAAAGAGGVRWRHAFPLPRASSVTPPSCFLPQELRSEAGRTRAQGGWGIASRPRPRFPSRQIRAFSPHARP